MLSTWTPDEDARLREMRTAGHSVEDIAEALGRSTRNIRERCRALRFGKGGKAWRKPPTNLVREEERNPVWPPQDTRDLTGYLCGDPLPGRSAFDRKE